MPSKKAEHLIADLKNQYTTEAFTVADMLETIASNNEPVMRTPQFLVQCLQELRNWTDYAIRGLQTKQGAQD